jgi:hypothetical protein
MFTCPGVGDDPGMTNPTVWLPLADLRALAAGAAPAERWPLWRWALAHPGRQDPEAAWVGELCRLVEEEAAALQAGCTGVAEERGDLQAALERLRRCEPEPAALRACLASQLVQVVGALHRWLVLEEAAGPQRAEWLWRSWEQLAWRQELEPELPDWWPPVREQLVRLGALAWLERARGLDPTSPEGIEACRQALTLLQALAPLHHPLPEWIELAQQELTGQLEQAEAVRGPGQAATPAAAVGPPISLTCISGRLSTLPAVLESLREQTLRPAHIHLHLSDSPHLLDAGVAADAPLIQELNSDPLVQLHWVPNLGPYRKIVAFLQAGGYGQGDGAQPEDDLFITVDDDTLYPPRFIEYVVRNYERHGCIVAHRGRRIRLQEGEPSGAFRPYADWHDGVREPRLANLPTGQSGVLYRRRWFPQDLELEAALALAPTHDDLWLRWLTARQGVPAVILQPNAAAKTNELAFPAASAEPIAQEKTLWHAYNGPAGGNDEATVAVQAYWQARGFDFAALLAEEQERQADFY